jgi:flagellar hook-basal body complex protein FliE
MSSPISPLRILPADMQNLSSDAISEPEGSFAETLNDVMNQMGDLQADAGSKVASVLEGDGGDVHSALIAVEKADLSFQLMLQVRNKIVSAYQEISRMQF